MLETKISRFQEDSNLPQNRMHPESDIEWWYFHGNFKVELNEFFFMLALFKHKVNLPGVFGNDFGYSSLLSILNQSAGTVKVFSRIDKIFYQNFLYNQDQAFRSAIEKRMLKIIFENLAVSGPPEPVKLSDSPVHSDPDRLNIVWDDYRIAQIGSSYYISFPGTDDLGKVEIELSPVSGWFEIPDVISGDKGDGRMFYHAMPRLTINGSVGNNPVAGEAWMDHQWGGYTWLFRDLDKREILGWDWYSFSLENGSDWVILIHREAETRKIIGQNAICHAADGAVLSSDNIEIEGLDTWESPSTLTVYPLETRIKLPELGLECMIKPLLAEQEIPVFYPIRSIWQGAISVEVTLNNEKFQSFGRMELHSYGYLFNFKDYLARISEKVDRSIESYLPKKFDDIQLQKFAGKPTWKFEPVAYDRVIAEPVWDLLLRKGKRWRPIFAYLLFSSLGIDPKPYEDILFTSVELIHTGSLIIDDIEDESQLRRGKESIHLRYGTDYAINAANTLYFLPSLMIMEHTGLNEKQRLSIHEIMMRQYVRAHFGQALDLYWSKNMTPGNLQEWMNDSIGPKILQMYALKTGSPVQGLAETAAVVSDMDNEKKEICVNYARNLGVAFQIIDDVKNFSDSNDWRKVCGEDLADGKLTYVILNSLLMLPEDQKKRLINILTSPELRKHQVNLDEGVALIRSSGSLERCRQEAKDLIDPSWHALEKLLHPTEHKLFLHLLTHFLVENE